MSSRRNSLSQSVAAQRCHENEESVFRWFDNRAIKELTLKSLEVDFAIIGAQKSGTSSLAYQLARHPSVCFCRLKEPHFFSTNEHWERSLPNYHRLFRLTLGHRYGEASTSYTFLPEYPETAARIHEYNPRMRMIYIMREPVDRIRSHYRHRLLRNAFDGAPEVEVLENPIYVNRSRYAMQVAPYLELFPREQLLLLIFEEYIAAPSATLETVAKFLGITPDGFARTPTTPQNVSSVEEQIQRRLLVRAATRFFGWTPQQWRQAFVDMQINRLQDEINRRPFPESLRPKLQRQLAGEVAAVESLMGRAIEAWSSEESGRFRSTTFTVPS